MLPEVEKHLRQHWHSKALMPVCVFMCAVSVLFTANARKHCLHLNGFSWVWMRMWRTRSLGFLNSLEQYGQPCQRTPFSSRMEPMLLFFSRAGLSGPCALLLSAAPSSSWFWSWDSLAVPSLCGCTTLSPLFSRAC
ncbi:hypothetical protein EYF80_046966 [Liparis tanakae]|uniref:Uncharacterized protein n=1 Tax=Liparis tanakae TaxID=230148 RepID=A0A4Z2FNM1_9TELE|nr:hypothetical protein EYF80_046966 [Liparis tanakae]